jgi:hypothetical protein
MKLTKQHFEFMADQIAPMLGTPTDIEHLADLLADTNEHFKRGTFTSRAIRNWEDRNLYFADEGGRT